MLLTPRSHRNKNQQKHQIFKYALPIFVMHLKKMSAIKIFHRFWIIRCGVLKGSVAPRAKKLWLKKSTYLETYIWKKSWVQIFWNLSDGNVRFQQSECKKINKISVYLKKDLIFSFIFDAPWIPCDEYPIRFYQTVHFLDFPYYKPLNKHPMWNRYQNDLKLVRQIYWDLQKQDLRSSQQFWQQKFFQ